MAHISPRRSRVDLHVVFLATLLAVTGHGADGFLSSVSAFVPQRCCFSHSQQTRLPHCSRSASHQEPSTPMLMTLASPEQLDELPKDHTHSVWGSWKEFSYPGSRPSSWAANALANFAEKTGGAWQTRYMGIIPANLMAAPYTTDWMKKNEQKDLLTTAWPKSMMTLIGLKSIIASDLSASQHGAIRDIFLEALGPKTILSIQPLLEFHMDRYIKKAESNAESGEPLKLIPLIKDLTLDMTAACFLGDISNEDLTTIRDTFNIMTHASRSFGFELPWPLSHTPIGKRAPFNYGYAMDQRRKVTKVMSAIIDKRAKEFSSEGFESKYVLDKMLERQATQRAKGGPGEGELEVDNGYILDNLMVSFAAGYGPTSAVLSRMVQILSSPDMGNVAEKVLEEVSNSSFKVGSESAGGLFANFPFVKSLTFEIARLFPPFDGAFRQPTEDLEFNGFKIPKGSKVVWSPVPVSMSEDFYPEPEKVCPFRFVNSKVTSVKPTGVTRTAEEPGQPCPPMYGFGRHYCPGRELSKMAAVLFLKKFYDTFDVKVTEGQDLTGGPVHNLPQDGMMVTLSKKVASVAA